MIKIKRIYKDPDESDGYRILVDRLWPRGVSKERAKINLWLKDVTPSDKLRKWYSHDPKKWDEFQKKYEMELVGKTDSLDEIRTMEKNQKTVTLLYAARDEKITHAVILQRILLGISEKK